MWQCHISASECRCYRLNGFSLLKRPPLSTDAAGSRVLEQSVGEWLEHVGFPQYESRLVLNGFDDLRFMVSLEKSIIDQHTSPVKPGDEAYTIQDIKMMLIVRSCNPTHSST